MRNAHRHDAASTSHPPRNGPAAAATPVRPDHAPIARARSSWRIVADSSARLPGTSIAAPTPCSARAAMSAPVVGATPQSSDATSERADPDGEHSAAAEPIAERAPEEEQRGQRHEVRVEHPLEVGEVRVEVAGHRGQGDVDDRAVEKRHARAEDRGGEHPPRSRRPPGHAVRPRRVRHFREPTPCSVILSNTCSYSPLSLTRGAPVWTRRSPSSCVTTSTSGRGSSISHRGSRARTRCSTSCSTCCRGPVPKSPCTTGSSSNRVAPPAGPLVRASTCPSSTRWPPRSARATPCRSDPCGATSTAMATTASRWHGDRVLRDRSDGLVVIVSVGHRRRFLIKPASGGPSRTFELGRGDLFVMGGDCQRRWRHSVPKVSPASLVGPRISITMRPG